MDVGQQGGSRKAGDPEQAAAAEWSALKGDVGNLADAAVEKGWSFVEAARTQATDYADRRKGDVAGTVSDLARSVRESSRGFEDRPNIKAFFDSAAEGLDHLSSSIENRSIEELFGEAETLIRRRPATVAAATAVAGFVIARFIKASATTLREGQVRHAGQARHDGQVRHEGQVRARARA